MSLKDNILKSAIGNLVQQQEKELKSILDERLTTWTEADIKDPCYIRKYAYGPKKDWEYLFLDNEPILEIGPIEFGEPILEGEKYVQVIHRQFRRL